MNYRHEIKHEINFSDMLILRQRLGAVLQRDRNAIDGKYFIRSLYFDDPEDTALREKLDGVSRREKFRFRIYNMNTDEIKLERKLKANGLTAKDVVSLTRAQAESILNGDAGWMKESPEALVRLFYERLCGMRLAPKCIVDYTREAFCHPAGNVRVTLDYNIRSGLSATDFLSDSVITVPACDGRIVLEVKWDAFLPDFVRDAARIPNRRSGAFSKYAVCRILE